MGSALTTKRKSNAKFMFLSAIGIMMVVDSHCWSPLNLFGSFLPYNSFFMPMFIFISGYFNKVDENTDLKKYIFKKTKTLLLPYLVMNFVVFWLSWLIDWFKTGSLPVITVSGLTEIATNTYTTGATISMAFPLWYLPALYVLLVVYAVFKKVFSKRWNSIVMFLIFTLLNIIVVWLSKNTMVIDMAMLPYKCMFFAPFLELGILYREKIEPRFAGLSKGGNIILLASLLMINMVRMMIMPKPYDIAFNDIATLTGFTSPFIVTPMISSLIGILFWVTVADMIGPSFGDNKVINYISENTLWIMGFHMVFFNLLNCILLVVNNYIVTMPAFDPEFFKTTVGYRWEHYAIFRIVYFAVGITGPLLMKLVFDKIKSSPGNKKAA